MAPYWGQAFGNPHSKSHQYGWEAKEAVDAARGQVADFIGADDGEIFFLSGATESCNLAIRGLAAAAPEERRHVVTVGTEHPAVLETVRWLACHGFEVDVLPVSKDGLLELDALHDVLSKRTLLVSVMLANNEIGVVQPLSDIAAISHSAGAYVHTDATQAAGRMAIDVAELNVDLLSLSAHKFYGPNGIGVLFVRGPVLRKLRPLLTGGSQERGLRPGTLPTPLVVGLGAASELAQQESAGDAKRLAALTTHFHTRLKDGYPEMRTFGSLSKRIPGSLSLGFPGILAEQLVNGLAGRVAISTGAACSSGSPEPSYVLQALGFERDVAATGVRISLGRQTTEAEVEFASETIGHTVRSLVDNI